jgi:hypothetical protein
LETAQKELHTFETKIGGNICMQQLRNIATEHEQEEVKMLELKWENVKTIAASRNSKRPSCQWQETGMMTTKPTSHEQ